MAKKKILLTSFATWRPDQPSNSSDDLLTALLQRVVLPQDWTLMRQVPVDFQQASTQIIAQIQAIHPDLVLCGGMAEPRSLLTLEAQAKTLETALPTGINLRALLPGLACTAISQDAGDFVCNALYYEVLRYIRDRQLPIQCLFVHVPILTPANLEPVVADYIEILQRLSHHTLERSVRIS